MDKTRRQPGREAKPSPDQRWELVCQEPSAPPRLRLRTNERPRPAPAEVIVRVEAASINPIDVKRASGYGSRVLGLMGAARFPLVLGNDVAGIVEALGADVTDLRVGQRVFGLVGTGRAGGTHASHVAVPRTQLLEAPDGADPVALATLPYSFTTMWLAVRSLGLDPRTAARKRVLVHGACGGLGRLCLQLLHAWGSEITAICSPGRREDCLAAGAHVAVERGPGRLEALAQDFDAALNFASWDAESMLVSRLSADALGYATTVHPLLGHFDDSGWLRGAWASRRDWSRGRAALRARAPNGHYAWTVFKPSPEALQALGSGVREGRLSLPVGTCVPIERALAGFEHVSAGKPGRAVLTFGRD